MFTQVNVNFQEFVLNCTNSISDFQANIYELYVYSVKYEKAAKLDCFQNYVARSGNFRVMNVSCVNFSWGISFSGFGRSRKIFNALPVPRVENGNLY